MGPINNIGGIFAKGFKQNLLLWSEDFSQASYTKSNVTLTADSTTAPDGTTTADKIVETVANNLHEVFQSYTMPTSGIVYTLSCYVKAFGRTKVMLILNNQAGTSTVTFDLTAVTASATSGSITDAGNGWYRVAVTERSSATGSRSNRVRIIDDLGNTSYVGDVTKGLYIWGMQLNTSSVGPYAKTQGTNLP